MHSSNPLISVIIPVYNGGNDFRRCLKALTACVDGDTREGRMNEAGEKYSEKTTAFAGVAQGALTQPLSPKNLSARALGASAGG